MTWNNDLIAGLDKIILTAGTDVTIESPGGVNPRPTRGVITDFEESDEALINEWGLQGRKLYIKTLGQAPAKLDTAIINGEKWGIKEVSDITGHNSAVICHECVIKKGN